MSDNQAPLAGIRVIELGSMYAAPTAGRMLRDFGADVVKIEDPTTGDFARQQITTAQGEQTNSPEERLTALINSGDTWTVV